MNKERRKAPKLRFPGFEGDWKQGRLVEFCDFINGDRSSNYPNSTEFVESGMPFVGSDSLGSTLVNKTKLRFITTEKYEQMNGLKIEMDDILYTLRGAGYGKCSIADFTGGTVASSLVGIRCKEPLQAKFLIQWLSSSNAEDQKSKAVNGSTAQNISVEDMKNYIVTIPSLAEQDIISEHLYSIDNLITLHQRKLDQIKEYKKGMLQKMFPKKGETVPEVRFPGFEGDWEQRKVGDLFSFIKQKNTDSSIDNVITNSAEFGLIPQREFFDKNIAIGERTNNYTVIQEGDFVYNPRKSTSAPYGPFNCYKLKEKGIVSPLYTCLTITSDDNTEFLLWYFKTDRWHSYIQLNGAQGGARHDRVGMTNDLMKNIPITIPSLEEQKYVASFLTNIELAIALYQRKLEQMKEYKRGLLQEMFV